MTPAGDGYVVPNGRITGTWEVSQTKSVVTNHFGDFHLQYARLVK